MHKMKKSDPKKILVRNTELPVPKTKFIVEGKPEGKEIKKAEVKTQKVVKSVKVQRKFHTPELNSALKIEEKIDKVEKTKSQKFEKVPDVAFCEKVTRQINFPADRAIYKDLIPLQVPAKSPPVLSSRDPLPLRDREPQLSMYAKPTKVKEYIYQPSIKLERQSKLSQLNNLRLYKIIQMNNP